MLKGKKILLAITGSIAAYKIPILVRLLIKAGAEVKIVMTPSATQFVSPLTLSTLSKFPVLTELANDNSWSNHVMLGRWADMMIIAPLSCNTLAKMATGICDNLLLAVYLSATCKVVVAPAMDEDMWLHAATKSNMERISSFGNLIIAVENGELASGLIGEGRMAEPESIVRWLENYFSKGLPLKGKKALVTAGPTHEQIDPVRFIGNNASGKMGIAIASKLINAGAEVTLVVGPTNQSISQGINIVNVKSAAEMYDAVTRIFDDMDIAILSAAVADFTPTITAVQKIKKSNNDNITIELTKTKDILKYLGQIKTNKQLLIGFALETNDEEKYALKKLVEKNADMIILNSLNDKGAGFGLDTNKITIFTKKGDVYQFETKPKVDVAEDIVDTIIGYKI